MTDGGQPWRHGAACVIVHFRLTPKSSKDSVDGLVETADGPAFQAHVRALPADGAANAALEKLVSEWLQVPKRFVRLDAGGKSRLKRLRVEGNVVDLDVRLLVRLAAFEAEEKDA